MECVYFAEMTRELTNMSVFMVVSAIKGSYWPCLNVLQAALRCCSAHCPDQGQGLPCTVLETVLLMHEP